MDQNKGTKEIDIKRLLFAVLRRWWIVAASAIICAILAFGYTKMFVPKKYQSYAWYYVNNVSKVDLQNITVGYQLNAADISAAKSLVDTYCVILQSRLTLEEVRNQLEIEQPGLKAKYSYGQLKGMITAKAVNETEIFQISITGTDPEEICLIANTIAKVLPNQIQKVIEGSSVKVVDYAVKSNSPISPSYSNETIKGFLIGFAISVLAILLIAFFNDVLDSEEWLTSTFGDEIPVLAVIPDITAHPGGYGYRKGYYRHYGYYKSHYGSYYGDYYTSDGVNEPKDPEVSGKKSDEVGGEKK